jgi:hypothetical protein
MAPSCALDEAGLSLQLQRYRRAGRRARLIERTSSRLVVELDPAVESRLVDELLAVERECCPFFTLEWEPDCRRLAVSVSESEHEAAVEAIAFALDVGGSTRRRASP